MQSKWQHKEKEPPLGKCNTENDSECCVEDKIYTTYFECSPSVVCHTKAFLTLNSFEEGGDGGGPSECDDQSTLMTNLWWRALSTGWFNEKKRCHKNITIRANGRTVVAVVVDECDSTIGCDADHDYQPSISEQHS
ncbi:hypothetical protein I3843_01G055300 [Carya illinoinensis]|uniref:Uncharacterized protein n=1 Tax=Carya illinoinensis TaxID=32201 RepID=A0A8T1RKC7_CARIL|nr:hypothetical protein I3760_01G054500 [Carya illinoinensis]KAG6666823.1 hypothetical protein CIPAW_01G059200 [Carya illinoinensis]KAG6729948.1 hypothetical protein I3842_01G056300 [Carya illinoinensis]KAG7994373.1 hypothetical protein I3843_01G055300 [Carya illinoinensis]